jgi:2',3'-cyclic-nucleotide 2'-phosphodiesterase/3'-nucleotidase
MSFDAAANTTHLRILQTTDVHLNLSAHDYFADKEDAAGGLLSLSSIVRQARTEAENTLLLDTGDFLQGTPLGDLYARNHPSGDALHPAISLMNAMEYDAGTIGNHEFNFGLDFLTQVTSRSRFPIVLANAAKTIGETPLDDCPLYQPYTILSREVIDHAGHARELKIGVIGFVPPQVSIWEKRHLQDRVHIRDIVETAHAYVPKMKADGADIIIALSHSGIAAPDAFTARENASMQLAAVDGIDVVLCGHQHKRFPSDDFEGIEGVDAQKGTLHGKPAIMAGHWGSELGVLDLVLVHDPAIGWRVSSHCSTLRAVQPETPVDATLGKLLDNNHQATLNYIRTPVAEIRQPLHTYFTYLGFDLATRAVTLAKRGRAAELLGQTDLPLLASASPFRAGGPAGPEYFTEVEAGPMTIRNLSDLYLFPNTLSVLRITGKELREWLERSAGKFRRVTQGQHNQPALTKGFPSYNFDMVLGVDYEIDLTQPARYSGQGELMHPDAHRISTLSYDGHPVRNDQEFLIATNSYRAGGAGFAHGQCFGTEVLETHEEVRTILEQFFRQKTDWNMPVTLNWRFAHAPDTSLMFPVSPKARRYLPQMPLNITRTGQMVDGFELYRYHL